MTKSELPAGLWTLALALWGVTTLTYVTGDADTLILGAFRPEQQVGIYSAVLTIGRLILVGSGAVAFIFLPVAARLLGQGNIAAIRSTFTTTARWTLLFTVPLFLVFAFLPGDSLFAVFGAAYVPGSQALVVVSLCALISVAFGPVNAALAGMAMTRPLLVATAASAISNIVLSFTLIPTFGLMGAAVAWSAARVIYPVAGATSLYFTHGITPLRRTLLLPLAGSLALGIPVFCRDRVDPAPQLDRLPTLLCRRGNLHRVLAGDPQYRGRRLRRLPPCGASLQTAAPETPTVHGAIFCHSRCSPQIVVIVPSPFLRSGGGPANVSLGPMPPKDGIPHDWSIGGGDPPLKAAAEAEASCYDDANTPFPSSCRRRILGSCTTRVIRRVTPPFARGVHARPALEPPPGLPVPP